MELEKKLRFFKMTSLLEFIAKQRRNWSERLVGTVSEHARKPLLQRAGQVGPEFVYYIEVL
jgi:TorA maturation chaperone TorD